MYQKFKKRESLLLLMLIVNKLLISQKTQSKSGVAIPYICTQQT